jgi:RecA-family ATPase
MALNKPAPAAANSDRLKFLCYREMKAMREPEWLVEGVIQRQSTALIFGKSNAFKSFIAIYIALAVETGRAWHGNGVQGGGMLYVATEGANGVGRLRVHAWYDYYHVPEVERGAHLYPREIRIDVTEDIGGLIRTMHDEGPFALIVLDIFGGTMSGSEIEDKTARAWVHGIQRILRETGASVLTVAHTGWQDDTRARMHTHFWGSFDSRLRVEGDKDARTATLTVERHKDADSAGSWGFRWRQAGKALCLSLTAA